MLIENRSNNSFVLSVSTFWIENLNILFSGYMSIIVRNFLTMYRITTHVFDWIDRPVKIDLPISKMKLFCDFHLHSLNLINNYHNTVIHARTECCGILYTVSVHNHSKERETSLTWPHNVWERIKIHYTTWGCCISFFLFRFFFRAKYLRHVMSCHREQSVSRKCRGWKGDYLFFLFQWLICLSWWMCGLRSSTIHCHMDPCHVFNYAIVL